MTDQDKTPAGAAQAGSAPAQSERRTVSDPRDVATLVMSRMSMVNAKKDELTIAIKGLSDVTQQLAHAYAEQMKAIEKLVKRVKALEAAGAAEASKGMNGSGLQ
ncbi:hypothetical protein N0K08_19110 [Acidovorax sp. Be4]|uniref:Uncharacterized protein n=1 Tax=Acidovorax bellezanensis TaxID=2976702 RepID=A0ABT2PS93_9BURK|nr:hypothetical protein [Acidovorax sp. Be4]MCT9812746.1 hypothetical protein [Acidovorax sp. Be4]